jgi:hypothetical protein
VNGTVPNSRPSQVYKRKASFLLGAARIRKRNQNDTSTLVQKKHLLCFLCSIHVHKTSFFFFLVSPT